MRLRTYSLSVCRCPTRCCMKGNANVPRSTGTAPLSARGCVLVRRNEVNNSCDSIRNGKHGVKGIPITNKVRHAQQPVYEDGLLQICPQGSEQAAGPRVKIILTETSFPIRGSGVATTLAGWAWGRTSCVVREADSCVGTAPACCGVTT